MASGFCAVKYLQLAEFGAKACGGKVTFQQSELAADITAVHSGKATKEYEDASAFCDRTFITGLFGEFRGTSVSVRRIHSCQGL
jgi:hypothetical protein